MAEARPGRKGRISTADVDLSCLAKSDTCRRLTLGRAERGGLSAMGQLIVDRGRPMPGPLALAAQDLIRDGLLTFMTRQQDVPPRIELTDRGRDELARLRADYEANALDRSRRSFGAHSNGAEPDAVSERAQRPDR